MAHLKAHNVPQREQTDASLRVERAKSDAVSAQNQDELDWRADTIVQVARDRADETTQAVRLDLESKLQASSAADAAESERNTIADKQLAHERAKGDAALIRERAAQREYFKVFLANEREATDANLMDERADADRIVASRNDFLAAVSHDLRSLLGGLSLSAELLLECAPEGAEGDLTRKCATTSQRLVSRMSRLVNDLLDMTSIEAGQVALLIEENNVAEVLRETLEAFEPIARAKGVALVGSTELPESVGRFDAGRVLQVLANLVSNSIKFTAPGGNVSIRIMLVANELCFTVNDTGVGIPQESLMCVFDKFKQVTQDRRGLGLGLHIAKGIVEAHGGRMWAESRVGVGSTFQFAIPNT